MSARSRTLVILAAAAAAVATVRHGRGAVAGRRVPGGILIGDAGIYDAMSRMALGSLHAGVAADVAAIAPDRARVLEAGCGPGHLAIGLASRHGLHVTGLDLDPAMIRRARANAERAEADETRRPSFLVGDVASLAFPDGSFDLVVSTLSMHHWADPAAGLGEIARVLGPGGRALIWDIRPGIVPLHSHVPDPVAHIRGAPLRLVRTAPWPWPWRLHLTQRIELVHTNGSPGPSPTSGPHAGNRPVA